MVVNVSSLQFKCLYVISLSKLFSRFRKEDIHFLKQVFNKIFMQHLIEVWETYLYPTILLTSLKIDFAGFQNIEYFSACLCSICRTGLEKFQQIGMSNATFPSSSRSVIKENLTFFDFQIIYLERFLDRNFGYELFCLTVVLNFKCEYYPTSDNCNNEKLRCLKNFYRSTGSEEAIFNVINFLPMLNVLTLSEMSKTDKLRFFLTNFNAYMRSISHL